MQILRATSLFTNVFRCLPKKVKVTYIRAMWVGKEKHRRRPFSSSLRNKYFCRLSDGMYSLTQILWYKIASVTTESISERRGDTDDDFIICRILQESAKQQAQERSDVASLICYELLGRKHRQKLLRSTEGRLF